MSRRPVWRRDVSDLDYRFCEMDGFYVEVYRERHPDGRWGWHVSGHRRGSRWFRFLAVRDALREIATLRGGRT